MEYTQELGEAICAEMIGGDDGRPKSLNTVLAKSGMPNKKTVMRWLHRHPEFEKIYRLAQKERAECWIEEIVDIADDTSGDFREGDDGKLRVDNEHINRSRLKVDTRKWIAAKMMPKLYGDKVDMTHEAGDSLQALLQAIDGKSRSLPG